MRLLVVVVMLSSMSGCASPRSVADVRVAFATLREAETVKTAYAGLEGELAEETRAFREVMAAPDAPRQFERLLEQAGLAGQMYALAGLYLVDRERFEAAAPRYRGDEREVKVLAGDVGGTAPVAAIVGYAASVGLPGSIREGSWPRSLAGDGGT